MVHWSCSRPYLTERSGCLAQDFFGQKKRPEGLLRQRRFQELLTNGAIRGGRHIPTGDHRNADPRSSRRLCSSSAATSSVPMDYKPSGPDRHWKDAPTKAARPITILFSFIFCLQKGIARKMRGISGGFQQFRNLMPRRHDVRASRRRRTDVHGFVAYGLCAAAFRRSSSMICCAPGRVSNSSGLKATGTIARRGRFSLHRSGEAHAGWSGSKR